MRLWFSFQYIFVQIKSNPRVDGLQFQTLAYPIISVSKVSSSGWLNKSPFYRPYSLDSLLHHIVWSGWLKGALAGAGEADRQLASALLSDGSSADVGQTKTNNFRKSSPFLCPQLVARAKPRLVLVTKRSGLICCSDGQARTSWTCSMVSCKQKPDSLHSWGGVGAPLLWNLMLRRNMVFSLDAKRLNDLAGAN